MPSLTAIGAGVLSLSLLAAAPGAQASKTSVSYRTGKTQTVTPSDGYDRRDTTANCRSRSDRALTAGWSGFPLAINAVEFQQAPERAFQSFSTVTWVGTPQGTVRTRAGVLCAKGSKVKLRQLTRKGSKASCGKDYAIGNPVPLNATDSSDEAARYVSRPSGTHGWVYSYPPSASGDVEVNCVSRKAFSGVKIVRETRALSGAATKITAKCPRARKVIGWGVDMPNLPANRFDDRTNSFTSSNTLASIEKAAPTSGNRGWQVTVKGADGKPIVEDALQTKDYLGTTVYAVCGKPR